MIRCQLLELNWQERSQWPLELKIGVCFLLGVACFLMTYFVCVLPSSQTYHFLKTEEEALKTALTKKYRKPVRLEVYRKQLSELNTHFHVLLALLPKQNEMITLLETISKAGTERGLVFKLFTPLKEIKHDFYIELPVKISVLGTYHQLGVFITQLTHMKRLLTVHDCTIFKAVENQAEPSLEHPEGRLLEMSMTINIYKRYLEAFRKLSVQRINKAIQTVKSRPSFSYTEKEIRRDPFNLKQTKLNRSNHPLEEIALESLKLVGVIEEGGRRIAIVMPTHGEIFQLSVGDRLSQNHARVVRVSKSMLILEASFFRDGKWIKERMKFYL